MQVLDRGNGSRGKQADSEVQPFPLRYKSDMYASVCAAISKSNLRLI